MGPMPSVWLTYFLVPDARATAEKVAALGGRTLLPPTPMPKVGTVAQYADDRGAVFGTLAPEPSAG